MSKQIKLELFQTVEDGSGTCPFSFRSLSSARKISGGDPDAKYYRRVYGTSVPETTGNGDGTVLDEFYGVMNRDDRPGKTAFRSMSMSDVVALSRPGKAPVYYYCDTIGFVRIDFDPSRAQP